MFHVKHHINPPNRRLCESLLPDAELAEHDVENILHIHASRDAAQRPGSETDVLSDEFGFAPDACASTVEVGGGVLKRPAMPRAR